MIIELQYKNSEKMCIITKTLKKQQIENKWRILSGNLK